MKPTPSCLVSLVSVAALAACIAGGAQAAPIDIVGYSQTGNTVINFEDIAGADFPGLVYNGLVTSGGAMFGERFQGQTLSFAVDPSSGAPTDVLSGAANGPLTLIAGALSQNLAIYRFGGNNSLVPCSALTCGHPHGYGEGSFAVLFSGPVSYFGFEELFTDSFAATSTLDFFNTSGGLIQRLTVSTVGSFGFARAGGVKDIAGVSVFTRDPGGLGYDNLVHDAVAVSGGIPEPASWVLMIAGFGLAGSALRRRSRTVVA